MRPFVTLTLLALLAGCRSLAGPGPSESQPIDAFALVAEVDRLAARDLWPGFDPRTVPVAIYDGDRTLLFRHPAPPEGFEPVAGREGVWAYPGRHPGVVANTSAEIGGTPTATLMPAAADSVPKWAGVLVHESFHVFQRQRHPGWRANEAELFTYPVGDAGVLTLRRLEAEALRRALASRDSADVACWGRAALGFRGERFALLPEKAVAYERGTEWNEGLASYVEGRALGRPDSDALPAEDFAPEALRQSAYAAGTALARLLDRTSPGWRDALEQKDSTPLDVLLAEALGPSGATRGCEIPPAQRDRIGAAATTDVKALLARRAELRRAFLEKSGWTLIVAASGAPLLSRGFDPMNVQIVMPGEILHTRWLKLGQEAGVVEVLGRAALTEAAGDHPLFNGVRKLIVTGLAGEPATHEAQGVVTIEAEGIHAELRGATVERAGQVVTVRLVPTSPTSPPVAQ